MAIPLFRLNADPVDLSGVEVNLGELGSVLSTSTNLDSLLLTSSLLDFSNGPHNLRITKGGIETKSTDLKKIVTWTNENVSTGIYLKDSTLNASFPANAALTPFGLTLSSEGESGNKVNMTSTSITVGSTSVNWTNVIATGAELQNIEAFVTPPNANTISIVNALEVKGLVGTSKIACVVNENDTSITQTGTTYLSNLTQESLNFRDSSGSGNYSANGILFYGNNGNRLRVNPSEITTILPAEFKVNSAGPLTLTSTGSITLTSTDLRITGNTLRDSLIDSVNVTTKYLPLVIDGVSYYVLLSIAA
jgi:hypothetical protein